MARKRPKRAGPAAAPLRLILPRNFNAEEILPPELKQYAGELKLVMHSVIVAICEGGQIDYTRLDIAVGGEDVRRALLDVLKKSGWIEDADAPITDKEYAYAISALEKMFGEVPELNGAGGHERPR